MTQATATKSQTQAIETKASAIIKDLKKKASDILGSVVSAPLQGFTVGAKGMFPYYWQDPSSLEFNAKTYDWISSHVEAGGSPAKLDGLFTNLYIQALSKISYGLSTTDRSKLNEAHQNATNQQVALLNAWKAAYGSLPSAPSGSSTPQQPIDLIISQIATQWAKPATTLTAIKNSHNLNALLNNVPASGEPIVPVFADYLDALGDAISLENAVTMNNSYVQQALLNVQSPATSSGGLSLDNGQTAPGYAVATQLSDILNGLQDEHNKVELDMSVSRSSSSEFRVSVEGGGSFGIPVLDFLTLGVGGRASYFRDEIATSSNSVQVTLTYSGVTFVSFGPQDYNQATSQGWYWMTPIKEAIQNGSADVSGYKFSPEPQIDFSDSGPFGFLTGAAISNYPSVKITMTGSNFHSVAQQFQQSSSVELTFLGIPLGIGASESSYSSSVETDASAQSVTITLNPPPELVAGTAVDSVGWVLGVETDYPAA